MSTTVAATVVSTTTAVNPAVSSTATSVGVTRSIPSSPSFPKSPIAPGVASLDGGSTTGGVLPPGIAKIETDLRPDFQPFGPALDASSDLWVNLPTEFFLKLPQDMQPGKLAVTVRGSLTPRPLKVLDNGDGTMKVVFTPRFKGRHIFEISWDDVPIKGSPFYVNISKDIARDVSKIRVECFNHFGISQPLPSSTDKALQGSTVDHRNHPKCVFVKFLVTANDHSGSGPLIVKVAGEGHPKVEVKPLSQQQFQVLFSASKRGYYKLLLAWGDDSHPLVGTPYYVVLTERPLPDSTTPATPETPYAFTSDEKVAGAGSGTASYLPIATNSPTIASARGGNLSARPSMLGSSPAPAV